MDFRKSPLVSYLTHRRAQGAALGLLAALAAFLVLYATPQGLSLSDDSIAYIAGARSLLSGDGYREAWLASDGPVTHFPPGFSAILAVVGLSGLDPLRGTRFVNSILFGANTFLLGLIGWRMTRSQVAGILLALLFVLNDSMLRVHTAAMSEPLYIFFTFASFLTFSEYMSLPYPKRRGVGGEVRDEGKTWLILTAILTAFAYLTRYAGLALLATFILALIILHDTWRKRLTSAGIFLAGFIPFALSWAVRNRLLTDNATNRTFVFHPITSQNIEPGIYNISTFLMPFEAWRRILVQIPNLFSIIFIILLLVLLTWVILRGINKFMRPVSETPEILSFVSVLYIFGYLASILSSMAFFDASTKFQLRILAPIFAGILIIFVYFLENLWPKQKLLSSSVFLIVLAFSLYGTFYAVIQLRKGGQGYASFQWFDSQAMKFLQTLPKDARIYSNEPGAVYLYTDRPAYVLPDLVDPVTDLPRGHFEEGLANLHKDVLSGQAALALFHFGRDEQSQSVYLQLSDGLYPAFDKQGDKIYTAFP